MEKKECKRFSDREILEANNAFYDAFSDQFEKIPFDDIVTGWFLKYAKGQGNRVLDIGSGPGALAKWVRDRGNSVLCVDSSDAMCQKCREKGLETVQGAIESIAIEGVFDHIFAVSSLIHIHPDTIPKVLEAVEASLAPQGIVYVSFLLGESSGMEDPTHTGSFRYFSRFTKEALQEMTAPLFKVLEEREVEVKKMNSRFLIQVLQKKQLSKRGEMRYEN